MNDGPEYERGRRDAQIEARFAALEQSQVENDRIQRALRADLEGIREMAEMFSQTEEIRREVDKSLQVSAQTLEKEARGAREAADRSARRSIDKRMFVVGILTVIAIWCGMFITLYSIVK